MNFSNFKNKVALITGGTRRLGRETALKLAKYGTNIVIHFNRSEKPAIDLIQELEETGVKAWKVQANLSELTEAEQLFEKIPEEAGSIDMLINNASNFMPSNLMEADSQDMISTMNLNALAPLILARQFVKQAKKGQIINLLDNRIYLYDTTHFSYLLSKKLLYHITECMAIKFGPDFLVNGVAPGLILPPEGRDESFFEDKLQNNLLHKHGEAEDIINTILFLLSSPFITGEIIKVDGGEYLKRLKHGD